MAATPRMRVLVLAKLMNSRRLNVALLVASVVILPCVWYFVAHIWAPPSRGVDLYPYWYGSRELLLHGRNPYSAEVSREIMQWVLGRAPLATEDTNRFAYPPWVCLLMAPTIRADYRTIDLLFLLLLPALAVASVPCWLRFVGWKPSVPSYAAILLFTLGSFAVIYGAYLRQLSLMCGFLLALAAILISRRRFVWAGVALALVTIKPQVMVLLIPWLLVWCVSGWAERKRLFWSFAAALSVLVGFGFWVLPDWPREFLRTVVEFSRYNDGRSVLQLTFTRPVGQLVAWLVIVLALVAAWRSRKVSHESREFSNCFVLLLTATVVVIPTVAVYNQVMLLPALFIVLREAHELWSGGKFSRLALVGCFTLFGAQLIMSAGLSAAVVLLRSNYARELWSVPVILSVITSPVVLLLLGFAVKGKTHGLGRAARAA